MSDEETSKLYWLLPILFNWIGGLTGWLALKDRNREKADNVLIAGIVILGIEVVAAGAWMATLLF